MQIPVPHLQPQISIIKGDSTCSAPRPLPGAQARDPGSQGSGTTNIYESRLESTVPSIVGLCKQRCSAQGHVFHVSERKVFRSGESNKNVGSIDKVFAPEGHENQQ